MEDVKSAILSNIKIMTRGGDEYQIKIAEDNMMKYQTSGEWQQYMRVYIDLVREADADIALVALIQIRYILKNRENDMSSDHRIEIMRLMWEWRPNIRQQMVGEYCYLMSHILVSEYGCGNLKYVGETVVGLLNSVEGSLKNVVEKGFTDNEIIVLFGIILEFIILFRSEKTFYSDEKRKEGESFWGELIKIFSPASTTYLKFLIRILNKVDSIDDRNRSEIIGLSDSWFQILKYVITEVNAPSELYETFGMFISSVPSLLEQSISNKQSFGFTIDILSKYMIFLTATLDYLKNSFDFLSKNLNLLLMIIGTPSIIKHLSQVF